MSRYDNIGWWKRNMEIIDVGTALTLGAAILWTVKGVKPS
jgi:hypothetical protein